MEPCQPHTGLRLVPGTSRGFQKKTTERKPPHDGCAQGTAIRVCFPDV